MKHDYMILCRDTQNNRNEVFNVLHQISIVGFNHFRQDKLYCFFICGDIETVFILSGKVSNFDCCEKTYEELESFVRTMFLKTLLKRK